MTVEGFRDLGDEIEATMLGGLIRIPKGDIERIEGAAVQGELQVKAPIEVGQDGLPVLRLGLWRWSERYFFEGQPTSDQSVRLECARPSDFVRAEWQAAATHRTCRVSPIRREEGAYTYTAECQSETGRVLEEVVLTVPSALAFRYSRRSRSEGQDLRIERDGALVGECRQP